MSLCQGAAVNFSPCLFLWKVFFPLTGELKFKIELRGFFLFSFLFSFFFSGMQGSDFKVIKIKDSYKSKKAVAVCRFYHL